MVHLSATSAIISKVPCRLFGSKEDEKRLFVIANDLFLYMSAQRAYDVINVSIVDFTTTVHTGANDRWNGLYKKKQSETPDVVGHTDW